MDVPASLPAPEQPADQPFMGPVRAALAGTLITVVGSEDGGTISERDAELVRRCTEGSEAACAELFSRYHRVLMPICLRYAQHAEEAKDILQEGFIRIFQHLGSYRGQGHFAGWLKRVMVNTAINHYRAETRMRTMARIEALDESGIPGAEHVEAVSRLTMDELVALVQALPPAYRLVFNLYVMEGCTHEAIAAQLGISVGASKSNLSRARAKLMEQAAALGHRAYFPERSNAR